MTDNEATFLKQFRATAAISISSLLIIVGGSLVSTHFKTRQLEVEIAAKADKELVNLNNSYISRELREIKDDLNTIQIDIKTYMNKR